MKQQNAHLCTTCRPAVAVCPQGDAVSVDSVTAKGQAVLPKNMEHLWNDTGKRRPEVFAEKPTIVSLCPTQIPYGHGWD